MEDSELKRAILQVLEAMQNCESTNPREQYQLQFLTSFRAAINLAKEPSPCKTLLENIAFAMFAGINMYEYNERTLHTLVPSQSPDEEASLSSQNIAQTLANDNATIKAAPEEFKKPKLAKDKQKLEGTIGFNFDPMQLNLPYIRSQENFVFNDGMTQNIAYLRHCSPTIEDSMIPTIVGHPLRLQTVQIAPEFEAFLSYLDRNNLHFLYVSHQSTHNAVENARNLKLSKLQEAHPSFAFIVLPMGDGNLFKEPISSINDFKIAIKESFKNQKNGISFPELAESEQLLSDMDKLLNLVHTLYFENQETLDPEKSKVFLLLFITYLKMHLKFRYEIDFTVSACKDNIDRGNASAGIEESVLTMLSGKENDPRYLQALRVQTAGPAFMAKKQEVIPERQRLIEIVLEHLGSLTDVQKTSIREETFKFWNLHNLDFFPIPQLAP